MSTTNVTPAEAETGLVYADGYIWAGSTITYSFPGAGAVWTGYAPGSEPFSPAYSTLNSTQAANAALAVEVWDLYIAPNMTPVSDAAPGDIRFAFTDVDVKYPGSDAYATSPPFPGNPPQPGNGDIWIDERLVSDEFAARSGRFQLLLHELGHALGLRHPFDSQTIPEQYENTTYTVMSYTNTDYFYAFSGGGGSIFVNVQATVAFTPMVLDIAAIQEHYGRDTATGAGDTTYVFTDTNLNGRQALYDAGGKDTLDISALSRGSVVDLRSGAYSDLAFYAVEDQIDDLSATYGEGNRPFIAQQLSDPNRPAYEWTKNLGIAFSTVIENAIGSASDDDITGNFALNELKGRGGNDTLDGGDGNDHLYGGAGSDRLLGGDGFDYTRYDDANYGSLTIRLDGGANTGAALGDVFVGIEGVVGGAGWDTIYGNGIANHLLGKGGTDAIRGGAGNDTLDGGDGSDHLYGGTGADRLIGGDGSAIDYARYDDGNYGSLTIRLDGGAGTGAAQGDVYVGIEGLVGGAGSDSIYGNGSANHLLGKGGNDSIRGGVGSDTLDGGDGSDHLSGGSGADRLIGGEGRDYARYDDGAWGNIVIRLDGGAGTGAAAGDTYSSIEGVIGGSGNDTIYGSTGADHLIGGTGNDFFSGNTGNDTIDGGWGADRIRFSTALSATNVDTIVGFQHDFDKIELSRSIFASIGTTLTADEFGSAADPNNFIIYQQGTGRLLYDAGGSGSGPGPILFATVAAGTVLDVGDFTMV